MAAVNPNNTPRLWVDYSDGVHDHSLMLRCADESQFAALMVIADGFLNAISANCYTLTIIGARTADQGTNVSNAITWTGSSTYGSGILLAPHAPFEMRWVGRDTLGHIVTWSLFGVNFNPPGNFRFLPGDDADIAASISVLEDAVDDGILVTVAGQLPVIKQYVNCQYNSYWENQQRP